MFSVFAALVALPFIAQCTCTRFCVSLEGALTVIFYLQLPSPQMTVRARIPFKPATTATRSPSPTMSPRTPAPLGRFATEANALSTGTSSRS